MCPFRVQRSIYGKEKFVSQDILQRVVIITNE